MSTITVPKAVLASFVAMATFMHEALNEGHGIHCHLTHWDDQDWEDSLETIEDLLMTSVCMDINAAMEGDLSDEGGDTT